MSHQIIKVLARPALRLLVSGVFVHGLYLLASKIFLWTGIKIPIHPIIPGVLTLAAFYYFNWIFNAIIKPLLIVGVSGLITSFAVYCLAVKFEVKELTSPSAQNWLFASFAAIAFGVMVYFKYKNHFIYKSLEEIDRLGNGDAKKGGFLFEEYIASLYRRLGYDAQTTGALKKKNLFKTKGFDQGADVVVNMIEHGVRRRAIVQCKLYSSPVGNKAVQEIIAAMAIYKADYSIVVTNNSFTEAAIELAQANNVFLVDREQLGILIEKARNPKLAAMVQTPEAA